MVQIEGFLEEMVLLCQRSEEYNQFIIAKIGALADAAKAEADAREASFRGGAFNMAVRELVSYYMALVRQPESSCTTASVLLASIIAMVLPAGDGDLSENSGERSYI